MTFSRGASHIQFHGIGFLGFEYAQYTHPYYTIN